MGIENLGTFIAAVLVLLALPGPAVFTLLAATGRGGPRAALATLGGLLLGDQLLIALAVAGAAAVLKANPAIFQILKMGGACYVIWIGIRLWWPPVDPPAAHLPKTGRHFRQGLGVALLNPKAILFYMLFLPVFVDPSRHQGLTTFAIMAAIILVLSFLYCALLIAIGHALSLRLQRQPRIRRGLQWLAGTCLIGFGVRLAAADLA